MLLENNRNKSCYICQNNDAGIVRQSSSGGIFYLLARVTLHKNGVVAGAGFDSNFDVCHSCAQSMESARAFMGSKYVQSDMGDVFEQVRIYLSGGREVLFSGTPCQIAGLQGFLGGAPDNLCTVGFICHGVPSPLIYRGYLAQISQGRRIASVSFRDKTYGWKRYSMRVTFGDGAAYCEPHGDDAYMKGFLRGLYLRPSCHKCAFKYPRMPGDITLGDFWGAETLRPDMDDNTGLSAVVVNTAKGSQMWDSVRNQAKHDETDIRALADRNPAYVRSPGVSPIKAPFTKKLRKNNGDLAKTVGYFYNEKSTSAKAFWKLYRKAYAVFPFHRGADTCVPASGDDTAPYMDKHGCCGCTACYAACPKDAIIMAPDDEGFLYPEIDRGLCVKCGKCRLVCPLYGEYTN